MLASMHIPRSLLLTPGESMCVGWLVHVQAAKQAGSLSHYRSLRKLHPHMPMSYFPELMPLAGEPLHITRKRHPGYVCVCFRLQRARRVLANHGLGRHTREVRVCQKQTPFLLAGVTHTHTSCSNRPHIAG